MPASDRRNARRLIMKVPLKFRPLQHGVDTEQSAAAMNISNHGVYFATDQKLPKGEMIQVHLKMPREVIGDDVAEWCFTGRVVHVESLSPTNGKLGIGVHFLYYEVPRAAL
ncbi:MAG TPA: PilZ domain-containing protein [Candidatus Cybelea sp.]|nr:PilZ domain-containing protein [Candidatus Cybelea sp.]